MATKKKTSDSKENKNTAKKVKTTKTAKTDATKKKTKVDKKAEVKTVVEVKEVEKKPATEEVKETVEVKPTEKSNDIKTEQPVTKAESETNIWKIIAIALAVIGLLVCLGKSGASNKETALKLTSVNFDNNTVLDIKVPGTWRYCPETSSFLEENENNILVSRAYTSVISADPDYWNSLKNDVLQNEEEIVSKVIDDDKLLLDLGDYNGDLMKEIVIFDKDSNSLIEVLMMNSSDGQIDEILSSIKVTVKDAE